MCVGWRGVCECSTQSGCSPEPPEVQHGLQPHCKNGISIVLRTRYIQHYIESLGQVIATILLQWYNSLRLRC